MRLMSSVVVAVGLVFLAACLPPGVQAGGKPDQTQRQACEAKGGTYEIAGRARQYICITPLSDAGKACETGSDCQGYCLSETKQCSTVTPQFGCIPHLDEAGRARVICID